MMLISLHLPKTAGESFGKSLQAHFGPGFQRIDDYPIHRPPWRRNLAALGQCAANGLRSYARIECIHGHFLPLKYLGLSQRIACRFITWLRDPVERLASHYHYWRRAYGSVSALSLHQRIVKEDWSFEKFCFCRQLRNFYSSFLWGFSWRRFSFIGITEHYAEDFAFFAEGFLGGKAPMFSENVNPQKDKTSYVADAALRRKIEAFHAWDMRLYEQALELRRKRLASRARSRVFMPEIGGARSAAAISRRRGGETGKVRYRLPPAA
jgi:hypothetical protein